MLPAGNKNHIAGFTLIVVLAMVVVVGVVAETAVTATSYQLKRDRELELLYRGKTIKDAIASYYRAGKTVKTFPRSLDDLVNDSRFAYKRHLRQAYLDPITNDDFEIIPSIDGGIAGVFSKSDLIPLKQANFTREFSDFEGVSRYSEWRFEYKPPTKKIKPVVKPK